MKDKRRLDPVELEIYNHLFSSIAEEMGAVLERTGFSPNIKERRDFSCALFTNKGEMFAQAAHIPVHLGSMGSAIRTTIKRMTLDEGDVAILNDPFLGGTHLPDITLIAPLFFCSECAGYAAARAHHSDIGGISPGSMPLSNEIFQEGLIIPPLKLFQNNKLNKDALNLILSNVRTPEERKGDIDAQKAALDKGISRILTLIRQYGLPDIQNAFRQLLDASEKGMRNEIRQLGEVQCQFEDFLDDDGWTNNPLRIRCKIYFSNGNAFLDFKGSSPQTDGPVNAVRAVSESAARYVFKAVFGKELPANDGAFRPIILKTEPGTIVDALFPAAVAAGNVETSQRIVDVLLGALSKIIPGKIPAAAAGTMSNLSLGGKDSGINSEPFSYYETIAGGMGGGEGKNGAHAVQTHMTNTRNTPVEALEFSYPLQVVRYEIRKNSGGKGQFYGGNGLIREIKTLVPARGALLADRFKRAPYGLKEGKPGNTAKAYIIDNRKRNDIKSKCNFELPPQSSICIETPGGGGYGSCDDKE